MKKKKIVILDGEVINPGDLSWDGLAQLGDLKIYARTENKDIIKRIGDAEIVFTNKTPLSKATLEQTSIKYIGLFSTGYNVIDTIETNRRGIIVSNVPSYSKNAVAQFTFALLLELCHRVQQHSDIVHEGAWSRSKNFCFWNVPQIELCNKVMGIIGYGEIGKNVARIALAMDMKVQVYTRTPQISTEDINFKFNDFNTVLKESDIVTIHCPLFDETRNLINTNTLALMKPSTFLINTARGGIVNENDIRTALNSEKLAGYATDVATTEPIPIDSPLLGATNCIITPHIAWVSKDTRTRLLSIVVNNLKAFLDNKPQNVVS